MKRALIVDDSAICREILRAILEEGGHFEVVGEAASGSEALELVARVRPHLVTLDVRMPGMDGLEVLSRLMAEHPCPVLVVTDLPTGPDGGVAFEAVRRGALDVARKPDPEDEAAVKRLRDQARLLATVPVVRHLGVRGSSQPAPLPSARPAGEVPPLAFERNGSQRPVRVVGIGASAGGPAAVATVLAALAHRTSATLAVVQHLPAGFAGSFARFLAERCKLEVIVAGRPVPVGGSKVVLPPDDRHLSCERGHLVASDAPAEHGLRPAVDVLFRSLATTYGSAVAAVVLTGIGRDGAEGLAAVRGAGGLTIAQDDATSAVWGMPRAAVMAGGAARVLPLGAIGPAIIAATTARSRR